MTAPFKLFYQTYGNPSHPPILFLHGFLGSHRDWESIISQCLPNYFSIAVDLPGHGKSPISGSIMTFSLCTDALEAVLKDLGSLKPLAVGYSMGGRLLLWTAIHRPHLFSRILLESVHPGIEEEKEQDQRIQSDALLSQKLKVMPFNDFLRYWYRSSMFASLIQTPDTFESIIQLRLDNNPEELSQALKYLGTGRQKPLWGELKNLNIPVHLLAGVLDEHYVRIARRIKNILPESSLHLIPKTGHNIHLENPKQFETILNEFLLNLK